VFSPQSVAVFSPVCESPQIPTPRYFAFDPETSCAKISNLLHFPAVWTALFPFFCMETPGPDSVCSKLIRQSGGFLFQIATQSELGTLWTESTTQCGTESVWTSSFQKNLTQDSVGPPKQWKRETQWKNMVEGGD